MVHEAWQKKDLETDKLSAFLHAERARTCPGAQVVRPSFASLLGHCPRCTNHRAAGGCNLRFHTWWACSLGAAALKMGKHPSTNHR